VGREVTLDLSDGSEAYSGEYDGSALTLYDSGFTEFVFKRS
jgi:hypothetical protein